VDEFADFALWKDAEPMTLGLIQANGNLSTNFSLCLIDFVIS